MLVALFSEQPLRQRGDWRSPCAAEGCPQVRVWFALLCVAPSPAIRLARSMRLSLYAVAAQLLPVQLRASNCWKHMLPKHLPRPAGGGGPDKGVLGTRPAAAPLRGTGAGTAASQHWQLRGRAPGAWHLRTAVPDLRLGGGAPPSVVVAPSLPACWHATHVCLCCHRCCCYL